MTQVDIKMENISSFPYRSDPYQLPTLNGCTRNTTAACGNVATGLLLRLAWPVHFLSCLGPFDAYHH